MFCFLQANYATSARVLTGYVDTLLGNWATIFFLTYQTMPVGWLVEYHDISPVLNFTGLVVIDSICILIKYAFRLYITIYESFVRKLWPKGG